MSVCSECAGQLQLRHRMVCSSCNYERRAYYHHAADNGPIYVAALSPEKQAALESVMRDFAGALTALADEPDPGATHWGDCWKAGPRHYHCAAAKLDELERYCRALMDKSPGWEHDRHHCGWNSALGHILAEFLGIDDSAITEDATHEGAK